MKVCVFVAAVLLTGGLPASVSYAQDCVDDAPPLVHDFTAGPVVEADEFVGDRQRLPSEVGTQFRVHVNDGALTGPCWSGIARVELSIDGTYYQADMSPLDGRWYGLPRLRLEEVVPVGVITPGVHEVVVTATDDAKNVGRLTQRIFVAEPFALTCEWIHGIYSPCQPAPALPQAS